MEIFQTILTKKVTRKEFIILAGALLLSITGIRQALSNLQSFGKTPVKEGFGAGPYGM